MVAIAETLEYQVYYCYITKSRLNVACSIKCFKFSLMTFANIVGVKFERLYSEAILGHRVYLNLIISSSLEFRNWEIYPEYNVAIISIVCG